jgi:hypothetical protein
VERRKRRWRVGNDWTWTRTAGLIVVLGLVAAGGVFAAFAAAAPVKKPEPTTTTVVTFTTTTITTTTTTVSTTTTPAPVVQVVSPPPPPAPSPPAPVADLSVQSLGADKDIYAGGRVTYTDIVTNNGPDSTSGVVLADDVVGGARVISALTSAGSCTGGDSVSCALGSLGVGSSAVVTVTMEAGTGSIVGHAARTSSDLPDPHTENNELRWQAAILPGHAGAPGVSPAGAGGAFRPPLVARASGAHARVVTTFVKLDEAATISVRVLDSAGLSQTLLPGSRIDYVPTQRPHLELPWVVDRARSVPLKLRIAAQPGQQFRIVIRAVGPTGVASETSIGFTT